MGEPEALLADMEDLSEEALIEESADFGPPKPFVNYMAIQEAAEKWRRDEKDVGSSEVQVPATRPPHAVAHTAQVLFEPARVSPAVVSCERTNINERGTVEVSGHSPHPPHTTHHQIARAHARIKYLTEHLQRNPKDYASRRGVCVGGWVC